MLFIIHINKCNPESAVYLEILLCSLVITFLEDSVFTQTLTPSENREFCGLHGNPCTITSLSCPTVQVRNAQSSQGWASWQL